MMENKRKGNHKPTNLRTIQKNCGRKFLHPALVPQKSYRKTKIQTIFVVVSWLVFSSWYFSSIQKLVMDVKIKSFFFVTQKIYVVCQCAFESAKIYVSILCCVFCYIAFICYVVYKLFLMCKSTRNCSALANNSITKSHRLHIMYQWTYQSFKVYFLECNLFIENTKNQEPYTDYMVQNLLSCFTGSFTRQFILYF